MTTKTKIFIGISAAVVVLAGGWKFIWTPINKGYCRSDTDCKFTCGCGCIPKNKICLKKIYCRPTICGSACRCENGECASWVEVYGEALKTKSIELCKQIRHQNCRERCLDKLRKEQVIITTDKRKYEQGETVKITLRNKADERLLVYYPFYTVERFEQGNWVPLRRVLCPCGVFCRIPPFLEIQAKDEIEEEWNQEESWCKEGMPAVSEATVSRQVSAGRYRIKSEIIWPEQTWEGRDRKTIYSNEFTIQ